MFYPRYLSTLLTAAFQDTPVLLVNGARQTGKTTLVQTIAGSRMGEAITYRTLDDATLLGAAKADPYAFIESQPEQVIIDEVQHCPELFPAIKLSVDRNRAPGRFILTGSANVLLLPKLSESLAGRMEILTLYPLSEAEIAGGRSTVIDELFALDFPALYSTAAVPRTELVRRVLTGGYPEPLQRATDSRRTSWYESYLTTILQRDVRDIANIEGLTLLPRLLAVLASRTANLLNVTDLAGSLNLPYATLHRYLALLKATYLVKRLPAWSGNPGSRLMKTPKVYLSDTGLAGHLLGLSAERLLENDGAGGKLLGSLLETYVMMELQKHSSWSETRPTLYHFRTQARQEVDIVLERRSGEVVGVEVKAAASVSASDFRGLKVLQETLGKRFLRGVVLYSGESTVAFGEGLYAVPLSFLWQ